MPGPHSASGDEQDDGRTGGKSKAHTTKDVSHVPCKFYKVGSCTAGSACPFSHSAAEPGQTRQVCNWFIKGQCKFAHKCALAHILPGQPMSMDRKNKKAAQQQHQAGGGQQGPSAGGQTNGSASGSGTGANAKPEDERGPRDSARRERDRNRHDRPPRDRPARDRGHREGGERSNGRAHGRGGDHPLASSTATLRPPIQLGKAPTISAAVTAPAVASTTSFTARNEEADPEKDSAAASLGQLQHVHLRQATLTQENVAMSDYSKTPSAAPAPLPPTATAPVVSSPKSELHAPGFTTGHNSTASDLQRSSPLPATSPRLPNALSHRDKDFGPIGSPRRADFGVVGSPPRSGLARNDLGPIGSPPRPNNAFNAVNESGGSALANLLAGLRHGADPPSPSIPHQNQQSERQPLPTQGMPSSHSSQSNLHLHAATAGFGTSPFATAGSKGLYMPYPDSASSSVASQSHMHTNMGGNVNMNPKDTTNGYPASFAGSRAFGWGSGNGNRRPSLPGHNQRPSIGAMSGGLNESALEEEDGDALEGEEFLPSSLNDLLTNEERARRFSRTGGRPTAGFQQDADEPSHWSKTIRRAPQEQHVPSTANDAFSRSVPATSILGNVRNIWNTEGAPPSGLSSQFNDLGTPQRAGIARALESAQGDESFASSITNFNPSSSVMGTSVASNASNAFLRSGRPGLGGMGYDSGDVGVAQFEVGVGQGFTSSNDIRNPIGSGAGGMPASYHPQSSLFRQPQPSQRLPHVQQHQQRSSLSALSASLRQSAPPPQDSSGSNPYPMYSGPANPNPNVNSSGGAFTLGSGQDQIQPTRPGPQPPHRQPLGPNMAAAGGPNMRHEPGQSLPRGLGAGLSRIHLVPAMGVSLSSGVGSPGSGVGSPLGTGFHGMASPPGFGGLRNGLPASGSGYHTGWPQGSNDLNVGLDTDKGGFGVGTTPTRTFASGLTARLAAAGLAPSSGGRQVNDLQPETGTAPMPVGATPAGSRWTNSSLDYPSRPPGLPSDLVDEGTLFME